MQNRVAKFKEKALITKCGRPCANGICCDGLYIQLDEAQTLRIGRNKLVHWEDSNGLKGGKNFVGASCKPRVRILRNFPR